MQPAIQLNTKSNPVGLNSFLRSKDNYNSSLHKEDITKSSFRNDDLRKVCAPETQPLDEEVYRGQTITYDTLHKKYSCHMDFNGSTKKCTSSTLKGIRRTIDLFKKKTDGFTPFMIIQACYLDLSVYYITDRRTDGKYVSKMAPDHPIQDTLDFEKARDAHTNYFLKYFFYNDAVFKKYQALCEKEEAFIKQIRQEMRECVAQLTQITENP